MSIIWGRGRTDGQLAWARRGDLYADGREKAVSIKVKTIRDDHQKRKGSGHAVRCEKNDKVHNGGNCATRGEPARRDLTICLTLPDVLKLSGESAIMRCAKPVQGSGEFRSSSRITWDRWPDRRKGIH